MSAVKDEVNRRRANNQQQYFCEEAVMAVLGTTTKSALTELPFVRKFEFGGSNGTPSFILRIALALIV